MAVDVLNGGRMDPARLIPIADSSRHHGALLYFKGYLSQNDDDPKDQARWRRVLRTAGWRGSIYHCWWDASEDEALAGRIGSGAGAGAAAGGAFLGPLGALVGLPLGGAVGAYSNWKKVKSRAKRVGREQVADLLRDVEEEGPLTMLGFSLGARVLYYFLEEAGDEVEVRNAVLWCVVDVWRWRFGGPESPTRRLAERVVGGLRRRTSNSRELRMEGS